jgi:hypothetical protein
MPTPFHHQHAHTFPFYGYVYFDFQYLCNWNGWISLIFGWKGQQFLYRWI